MEGFPVAWELGTYGPGPLGPGSWDIPLGNLHMHVA